MTCIIRVSVYTSGNTHLLNNNNNNILTQSKIGCTHLSLCDYEIHALT